MKRSLVLFSFAITVLLGNVVVPSYKNSNNAQAKSIDIMVKPRKITNKNTSSSNVSTSSKNIVQVKSNNFSGEKIKWYSYEDGIKKSKETNKYVLIDFYTTWCGYCKKLDKETYTNEKVYKYVNEKFIAIKVNAESENKVVVDGKSITERELARNFNVSGYPHLVFVQNQGEVIDRIPGYLNAKDFYDFATYIGTNSFKTQDLDEYIKSNKS